MAKSLKAAVLLFPGSNRERDVARALVQAGASVEIVWHEQDKLPPDTDLAVLPGGFSYGDYLRCGAIARFSPIMKAVIDDARAGKLVIGTCNGFQILCEAGLLPGALVRNRSLHFVCELVTLRVEVDSSPFTLGLTRGSLLRIPIRRP